MLGLPPRFVKAEPKYLLTWRSDMVPISGEETREETWLKAIKHLLNAEDNMEYNLIMEIANPVKRNAQSIKIAKAFEALLESSGKPPLHTVADTIFPAFEYKKHGKAGVFEVYPNEIYPIIKCDKANNYGTYAYRLVRGYGPDGKECRPLENVMKKLESQIKNPNGKRCVFELSVDGFSTDAVETIPINRNDTKPFWGFPCLSHLSFKLNRDRSALHLTAIYRSHYYIEKALGNLLGLARLQAFMARELGIEPGILVCHSTLAKLDHTNPSKKRIKAFINQIEEATNAGQ
jgi:hypothetical protein